MYVKETTEERKAREAREQQKIRELMEAQQQYSFDQSELATVPISVENTVTPYRSYLDCARSWGQEEAASKHDQAFEVMKQRGFLEAIRDSILGISFRDEDSVQVAVSHAILTWCLENNMPLYYVCNQVTVDVRLAAKRVEFLFSNPKNLHRTQAQQIFGEVPNV